MPRRKWTNAQLIEAIKTSTMKKDVFNKLGLSYCSGSYRTLDKYIKLLNIDISHFEDTKKDLYYARAKIRRVPKEEIFFKNSKLDRAYLRTVVKRDCLIIYKCAECGITTWLNKELSLELDHINGCHNDNELDNLRWLCPNCHSQTKTYCGNKRLDTKTAIQNP